jgi:hypothetical protein
MYHPRKHFTLQKLLVFLSFAVLSTGPSLAAPFDSSHLTTSISQLNGGLSFVTGSFPSLPGKKALKNKPAQINIYQYDDKPLGDRTPFLLVHGLRGEYYQQFRWPRVVKRFTASDEFNRQYKIYMMRWDTTARLDTNVPKFRQALSQLFEAGQRKPISVMALSMGGNLVYESMLDKKTDDMVKFVLALGSPFRGSPLFCSEWIQYSIYKNLSWPWTRVDHSIAYKLYFDRNPALLQDLRWDDADRAIPDVGNFRSKLLFGPKGTLFAAGMNNERLLHVNSKPFDRNKLICYGGYLLNPYMQSETKRIIDSTISFPYTLVTMKVPAHLAREHPVLKMLNNQITTVVPATEAAKRAGTNYIYQLNDGITPLDSALFLPSTAVKAESICKESDLTKIRAMTNVRLARVFRDIDHLTFIDGYRPHRSKAELKDELNPDAGSRKIFDWMLSDILNFDRQTKQIARESTPDAVPSNTD